jgi:hypothetical protein
VIGFLRRLGDERARRAHKRRRTEEIMGWICVPVILVLGWYSWKAFEEATTTRPDLREIFVPSTTAIQRR